MDLKNINLCPQLQKRKQKFREVKVLATSTQLFRGLTRPGIQLLTPSPGHPTKQLSPSSQFLPFHIFSSPFLKEAWCRCSLEVSWLLLGQQASLEAKNPFRRAPLPRALNRALWVTIFEDSFPSSQLKIVPAISLALETSEWGPKGMGKFITWWNDLHSA